MAKIDDSSGANVDLKENRGATIWRRLTANDLTDLTGYTVFARLMPRGADPIEITDVLVSTNVIEFQFDTTTVPNRCAYEVGWIDPLGKTEVLIYGQVLLV